MTVAELEALVGLRWHLRQVAASSDWPRGADKTLFRIDQDLGELLGEVDWQFGYPGPGWQGT